MTIENPNAHQVPFSFETDHHVQDFVMPTEAELQTWTDQTAETWDDQDDVTGYIDYNVEQIRNLTALAQAAEEKAKFASKTAKGFKANVEYRRGLIEASLNSAVSRGLLPKPAVKSAEYSLGIQGTAGSVEIDPEFDYWREQLNDELTEVLQLIVGQIMDGSSIELDPDTTAKLARYSTVYLENADSATDEDVKTLVVKTSLSWDKKYLAQALKNNWLTEKLAGLFKVVKGKALVIRL
jgi:hypothetical protein